MCSDPGAWALFPTWEALRWMDERAGDAANWRPRSWPFVLFFQAGAILEGRHQKKNSACDELKLDKMWWGINGERKENKRGKWTFHYQRGSFLKTASNYSTLHIHFTPGSFALYLESKRFCHMSWGEIEADANGPGFGALVVTRERGKETQDFKNSPSGLILFPSVQTDSRKFIDRDIKEGAYKRNCDGDNHR